MKRIDRLVIGELFGPWAFGVAIFTVLITAGSFLFQLTEYLAEGSSPLQVGELAALLLPGVMAKTFPMAVLLSTLLGFGRLSSDSEVVAMKAAWISVARMMAPVAAFGLFVFLLTFTFNELLVPAATRRAVSLREEMDKAVEGRSAQPTSRPIFEDGKLRALLTAKDFSFARRTLTDVIVTAMDKDEQPQVYLWAKELVFTDAETWQIKGQAVLTPVDGGSRVVFKDGVWPEQVPRPNMTANDLLAQTLRNLDALSMAETGKQIARERANPQADLSQIANLEFGYWNKIAVPLGALVFGLVGAPLGIRSHRTGAATGFWLSVVIIFAYLLVANVMSIFAQGGRIPAVVASFTPIALGLATSGWLIKQRNG